MRCPDYDSGVHADSVHILRPTASINDKRNGHSMGIERGQPEGIAHTFETSTDVSGCFE